MIKKTSELKEAIERIEEPLFSILMYMAEQIEELKRKQCWHHKTYGGI